MKERLLQWVRCPECYGNLRLEDERYEDSEVKKGKLACTCGCQYEISDFIPRFVNTDKYVGSFSFEWKVHGRTQLDSANINNVMRNESKNSVA